MHRILNNFCHIEIESRNFDSLINDLIDKKITYALIKKNKNDNSNNFDESNERRKHNFQKDDLLENIQFSFLSGDLISNTDLLGLDEIFKLKLYSKFTKITKFKSLVLVKIKGFNLYSNWFENILLPWEAISNIYFQKHVFEKVKILKSFSDINNQENCLNYLIKPNEEKRFYFKFLKNDKIKSLKFFCYFTEFLIRLLTINFNKNVNNVDIKESKKSSYININDKDSFEISNINKIYDDNICYFILKKINVEYSNRLITHFLNFDYIKYKNLLLQKKLFLSKKKFEDNKLIENKIEKKCIVNNTAFNDLDIYRNLIHSKSQNFDKLDIIKKEFLYKDNENLIKKLEFYITTKLNLHNDLLPYSGLGFEFTPNLDHFQSRVNNKNYLQSLIIHSDQINEIIIDSKNFQSQINNEIKEYSKFFYCNKIKIKDNGYIIKLNLIKNRSNSDTSSFMILYLKPILNSKLFMLKIKSQKIINSIITNYKNLEIKENEVHNFKSFNNLIAKYINLDKIQKKNYSKMSISFTEPKVNFGFKTLENEHLKNIKKIKDEEMSKNLLDLNLNPHHLNNCQDGYLILRHLSSISFSNHLMLLINKKIKDSNFKLQNLYFKLENTYNKINTNFQNAENLKFLNVKVNTIKNETFSSFLNFFDKDINNNNNNQTDLKINFNAFSSKDKKLFIVNIEVISVSYSFCDNEVNKYKEKTNSEKNKLTYDMYLEEKSKLFFSISQKNNNVKENININNEIDHNQENKNLTKNSKNLNQNLYNFHQNPINSLYNHKVENIFHKTESIQKNLIFKINNFINIIKVYDRKDCKEYNFIFDLYKLSEFIKYLTNNKLMNLYFTSNANTNFFYFNLEEFNKLETINRNDSILNFCKERLLDNFRFIEGFTKEKQIKIRFLKVRNFFEENKKLIKQERQKDISQPTIKYLGNNNADDSKDPKNKWLETKILIQVNPKRNRYLNEFYEITLNEIKRITFKKKKTENN